MPSPEVKVAIVEDQDGIREGLALLIGTSPGFSCCGRFGSMEEALATVGRDVPDVMLVDIGLPGMSGIEGVRLIKEKHPGIAAVMLTVYDDDRRIFEAICAGAYGYLLKKTPPARLLQSIREVAEGGAPMSPEVARRVVSLFREGRTAAPERMLTDQETRILSLLVKGNSYKTAAAELDISVHTVRFHLRNIYDKLQVHSKSEAVAKALRGRIVP